MDFTNKSQTINSPRSIEACNLAGVEPSELFQLSLEEYKKKFPEVIGLSEKLLKYRYDAEEKFRNETVEQVKQMRKKIIEAQEKKKEKEEKTAKDNETIRTNNAGIEDSEKKWEKLIENEKKTIEKIKKKQRQDIETIIEEQINKELMMKVSEAKEQIKKEKEEEAEKRLKEKRTLEERERREKEKKKEDGLKKQAELQEKKCPQSKMMINYYQKWSKH